MSAAFFSSFARRSLRSAGAASRLRLLGRSLSLLLRLHVLAGCLVDYLHGQAHLPALINPKQLDLHLVAFLYNVGDLVNPARGELADVYQAVLDAEEVHEGAEVHHLDHGAVIYHADFRLGGNRLDPVDGGLDRVGIGGGDLHRTVIFDVDLGAGLLYDFSDHSAARADDFADLIGRDLEHLDTRRVLAELCAVLRDRLGHFT